MLWVLIRIASATYFYGEIRKIIPYHKIPFLSIPRIQIKQEVQEPSFQEKIQS